MAHLVKISLNGFMFIDVFTAAVIPLALFPIKDPNAFASGDPSDVTTVS